ncbi:MAG: 23S rRNA (adenine(2503)-C(2))-methyltransferase RlmN [Prevotellaceae bacterium]|jgi:23S rRNA (adenine2503-C2)-methyltransferase|nr:23S rRNA (adenine(2503)-C(2))-methyltransferase RlmN [Prevotellaceae bacterium]
MKQYLFGKTLDELKESTSSLGLPAFTARQLADWFYKKKITNFAEMTNLSIKARAVLAENFELGRILPCNFQSSFDGTKKYLFRIFSGHYIEAVYIPDKDRATLCVSSQAGCRMGCRFCVTARQGFQANLTAGEILNQMYSILESEKLTNLVYMGMGEPMDNIDEVLKSLEIITANYGLAWSPKRVTVSTIGVLPAMKRFLDKSKCHLAVSLHNPFDDERQKLMPMQKAYPIADAIKLIRGYDFTGQRRVSFEYIMFAGVNDSDCHANALVQLLKGLECRVNLIRFHPISGSELHTSDDKTIERFKNTLNSKGVLTTIRASRGLDILAACGMLSTKEKNSKN